MDASITNRMQEMEERISGIEDTIDEIGSLAKENIKANKNHNTKYPGQHEKTKRKNNRTKKEKNTSSNIENIFKKLWKETFPTQRMRCV